MINSKRENKDSKFLPTIQYSSEELKNFKNEILSLLSENTKKLEEKIEKYKIQITKTENEYEKNTKKISFQYNEIINNQANINSKLDKLKGYDSFVLKTNDQITSHELKLNSIKTDLSKSIQKYDKIYLDNLIVPGYIGEFSKYKNCQFFFDDVILQLSKLNSFKEKNILDFKSYKEKLDSYIKTFNLIIENNSKANLKYANEIGEKIEKNCKDMIEIVNEKLMDLRIENSKYSIEIKNKYLDLNKEYENILNIKNEIYNKFDREINSFKNLSNNTISSFNEFKKEFGNIKFKFFELAEFIKDIRFRKNIGGNIQKKEIKEVVKKITNKRKNSFDDSDLKINKKEKEILNFNFSKNDIKNNKRECHSHENKYRNNIFKNNKNKNISNNSTINTTNIKKINITNNEENDSILTSSNNNRLLFDVDLETNDNIIKELASELEQSAKKIDKLKNNLNKDNNDKNIKEKLQNINCEKIDFGKNTLRSFSTKNLNNNFSFEGNFKEKKLNLNNNNNIANFFDLKKGYKELNKRINILDKKIINFENLVQQKLNEYSYKENNNDNINNNNNNNNNNIQNLNFNMTNYANHSSNNFNQIINSKYNNNKIPIIEIGAKFNSNLQQKNIRKIIPLNYSNTNNNIMKSGKMIKIEKNLNQTLENNINNENNINFTNEYKILRKIESKKSSINQNLNSEFNNNNIQSTKWIQLNKITTNKSPKSQNNIKLSDLLLKEDLN